MPGWRIGFCAGNSELVAALVRMKSYLDYGIFAPAQLAAAHALAHCDADVAQNRELYRHRAAHLCGQLAAAGWDVPMPKATMFVWAPLPQRHREDGSVRFAMDLLRSVGVAVSPGAGFGENGDGYVRFSLVENDARVTAAVAQIAKFLA